MAENGSGFFHFYLCNVLALDDGQLLFDLLASVVGPRFLLSYVA